MEERRWKKEDLSWSIIWRKLKDLTDYHNKKHSPRYVEKERRRAKRKVAELYDYYLANKMHGKIEDFSPEMFAVKREQLKLSRLIKDIKNGKT